MRLKWEKVQKGPTTGIGPLQGLWSPPQLRVSGLWSRQVTGGQRHMPLYPHGGQPQYLSKCQGQATCSTVTLGPQQVCRFPDHTLELQNLKFSPGSRGDPSAHRGWRPIRLGWIPNIHTVPYSRSLTLRDLCDI